jgi:predicted nucleic-acid-binding protein
MRGQSKFVGMDTSFVLRLLVGEPTDQAALAVQKMDQMRELGMHLALSDIVVAETYFALQFHYEVPKQKALDALLAILESPEIAPLGESIHVLKQANLGKSKPGFIDRLIHAIYQQQGAPLLTFEKASKKLSNALVIL